LRQTFATLEDDVIIRPPAAARQVGRPRQELGKGSNVRFSGKKNDVGSRYDEIREQIRVAAVSQAKARQVDIPQEAFKIAETCGGLMAKREWIDYRDIANFLLAEYETELGFYVANAFSNFTEQLGHDPFGKIMLATQYVDRTAGSPMSIRFSFAKQHQLFYEFLTERECPERTRLAVEFLGTAVFQFPNVSHAKKVFPTLFVVPEMGGAVRERLYLIDRAVAECLLK